MFEEPDGRDRGTTFAEALDALKSRGSMLLVVGTGGNLGAVCEKLRGDAEGRRRLTVRTGGGSARPGSDVGVPSRTIQYGADTRSATAADAGPAAPDRVVESSLPDLQTAIGGAIASLEPADGYDPGELRVCVDAADVLLSRHDGGRVFRLFHALGGQMRETRGMCHVHLPVAYDDEHVQLLAPLFDAVVEVRRGTEQRWHLYDPEMTTDWVPL